MISMMERSTEMCLGLQISGKVTAEDYRQFRPIVQQAIASHGTVSLVVVLDDFEGLGDVQVVREDLDLLLNEYQDVVRTAVVGPERWQKWITRALSWLTLETKERYFRPEDEDAAWAWACGET